MLRLALALVLVNCTDSDPRSDALDDPQLPPRGADDLMTWLDAGHYQAWSCEAEPHEPRAPSAHSANRICSNDAVAGAANTARYPVGAASVKEIFDSQGTLFAFAVSRRVGTGTNGDSWYWFEGTRDTTYADGEGAGGCIGCHGTAHDFVFTLVAR